MVISFSLLRKCTINFINASTCSCTFYVVLTFVPITCCESLITISMHQCWLSPRALRVL